MKKSALTLLIVATAFVTAHAEGDAISGAMKKYHKAPKGTDPVCKKASNGAASDEELAGLLKCYQEMCAAKPPQGEKADWVKKCQALIGAVKQIQAKDSAGVAAYKEAVNCKGCHDVFKPKK